MANRAVKVIVYGRTLKAKPKRHARGWYAQLVDDGNNIWYSSYPEGFDTRQQALDWSIEWAELEGGKVVEAK